MKPDRPLIGAVVLLATRSGFTILKYCQGTTAFNVAYPFSGSTLHIDLTTTGPAVLGGLALIAIGLMFPAVVIIRRDCSSDQPPGWHQRRSDGEHHRQTQGTRI